MAEEGYRFVNWTGDTSTIANLEATSTNITVNGSYYIRANFGLECTPIVAAGWRHTVGLEAYGTVVAVELNGDGQCDVNGWTDIVRVVGGAYHTLGLKSNGTVVAAGDGSSGQYNVGNWTDIVQVAASFCHCVDGRLSTM